MVSEEEHPVFLGSHVAADVRLDWDRADESKDGVREVRESTISIEQSREVGRDEGEEVVGEQRHVRPECKRKLQGKERRGVS